MAAIPSTIAEREDVSVEQYLARFVDGDEKPTCEYVDGELFPKSMGTKKHSKTQQNIQYYIRQKYGEQFDPLPELTTRLRTKKFYVPDVTVEDRAHPIQDRYAAPGDRLFLCVEIVSPPDRTEKLFGKCKEYHKWGVRYCWVIDPERKIAWEYTPDDVEPRRVADVLTAGPVTLTLDEVFDGV